MEYTFGVGGGGGGGGGGGDGGDGGICDDSDEGLRLQRVNDVICFIDGPVTTQSCTQTVFVADAAAGSRCWAERVPVWVAGMTALINRTVSLHGLVIDADSPRTSATVLHDRRLYDLLANLVVFVLSGVTGVLCPWADLLARVPPCVVVRGSNGEYYSARPDRYTAMALWLVSNARAQSRECTDGALEFVRLVDRKGISHPEQFCASPPASIRPCSNAEQCDADLNDAIRDIIVGILVHLRDAVYTEQPDGALVVTTSRWSARIHRRHGADPWTVDRTDTCVPLPSGRLVAAASAVTGATNPAEPCADASRHVKPAKMTDMHAMVQTQAARLDVLCAILEPRLCLTRDPRIQSLFDAIASKALKLNAIARRIAVKRAASRLVPRNPRDREPSGGGGGGGSCSSGGGEVSRARQKRAQNSLAASKARIVRSIANIQEQLIIALQYWLIVTLGNEDVREQLAGPSFSTLAAGAYLSTTNSQIYAQLIETVGVPDVDTSDSDEQGGAQPAPKRTRRM